MIRTVLVLLIIGAGSVAALVNRFAALLLYVWFAVFRPQEWVWFDISRYRPSLVLGLLLIVPCLISGILPTLAHPIAWGSLAYLASGAVAQIGAVDSDTAAQWLGQLARLILVSLFAITLLTTPRRFVALLAVVALSFAVHSASGGLSYVLAGGTRFSVGPGGSFADNNDYATGIVMILPLLVVLAQNAERRVVKGGLAVAASLSVLTVIGTYSRAGFLGLVSGTVVWTLLQKSKVMALTLGALLVAATLIVLPIKSDYLARLETIRTYNEVGETSAQSRLHLWKTALAMSVDHPFGVGLRNFEANYDRYDTTGGRFGHDRAVHNSHLQTLAELGFAGLASWVFLFISSFRIAWRVRRRALRHDVPQGTEHLWLSAANGFLTSMFGFLVAGTFGSMSYNDITWLTFALVAGMDRLSHGTLSTNPGEVLAPVHATV